MTAYVLVVIAAVVAVVAWAFVRAGTARILLGLVVAALTLLAAVATLFESPLDGDQRPVLILFGLILAVAGGSVVTIAVFRQVDSAPTGDDSRSMASAGEVLRGGAWIGALERFAVFLTLAARWPEGVAVVLAVKGLGRYPELRNSNRTGAAERFIIGTLVSLVWAALCAYIVLDSVLDIGFGSEPYLITR